MTRIGIIGGGRAATLHADAVLQARGVELMGVGGRPGTAGVLAAAAGVPDLSLPDLCDADALVVAVPSSSVASVLALIEDQRAGGARVRALLVEGPLPVGLVADLPAQLAANLLHAPEVMRALREIAAMQPHHLQLRVTQPRPHSRTHADPDLGGPRHDPGGRLLPLLLAAAGEPATAATTEIQDADHARVRLDLVSGRTAVLDARWAHTSARIELEVADSAGVISVVCDPLPRLEIGGEAVQGPERHPLEALGFTGQIDRLAKVADGSAQPWPELDVGMGVADLLRR